ncbi:hypothetical protein ANRL3_02343 [Anaerolineae bacterium]|nr:hypothetical protein ANRL3_02343 [Anaerolineae bacterium]
MKKRFILPAFALLALLLFACNPAQPAVSPSEAAPASPTVSLNTPLPTTMATPVLLPTVARTPSLAPPTPSPVLVALKKTQAAQTYRVTLQLNVKAGGNAPPFAFNLKGEVVGSDEHSSYQLGGEQIEFTGVRGQFYVKGARNLNLPTTTKWYAVTPDIADAARPPFSPADILDDFVDQAGSASYQSTARESLDGQNCQVWRAVPKSANETGIGNLLGAGQDTSAFGALDQAEVKLWICDDGILHQLGIELAGHNAKSVNQKGTAQLQMRLQDIQNPAIKITAPTGAEPFQIRVPTP